MPLQKGEHPLLTYAIISPDRDAPWGYYTSHEPPTLEQMADHMAAIHGYPSRDEWLRTHHINLIGFAVVQ